MKTSLIVTTANEPFDLDTCLSFLYQTENNTYLDEILVIAPDTKSKEVVDSYNATTRFKNKLKFVKDKGKGKIAALNLGLKKAQGAIILFTDGDCVVYGIEDIVESFINDQVMVATGQVVFNKNPGNKWEFFHKFLVKAAHHMRTKSGFIEATGYLFAIRKGFTEEFPCDVAEDSWASAEAFKKGYKVVYCPSSWVVVKPPMNMRDWIKQKTRTALAPERQQGPRMKSF